MIQKLATVHQLPKRSRHRGLKLFLISAALVAPVVLIWVISAALIARQLAFAPIPSPPGMAEAPSLGPLLGPSAQRIELAPRDGKRLGLWILDAAGGGEKAAVIVVCPNLQNPAQAAAYVQMLHDLGWRAAVLDYWPGAQPTDAGDRGFGFRQRADVIAAAAALKARGISRLGVLGVSDGGAAAIFAAAQDPALAAVISDSSYADLKQFLLRTPPLGPLNPLFDRTVLWVLGLKLGRAPAAIAPAQAVTELDHRPLMVIAGSEDWLTLPADAQAIYRHAAGPKTLWLVPRASQADALAIAPQEYRRRVGEFLHRYLPAD